MIALKHTALAVIIITMSLTGVPTGAQMRDSSDDSDWRSAPSSSAPMLPSGQTADTGNGKVGQRQSADNTAFNVSPTGRISTRIEMRITSRLRTRIDPDYDPQASAASVLRESTDRLQIANRPSRQ
jgi:hypothetical protein